MLPATPRTRQRVYAYRQELEPGDERAWIVSRTLVLVVDVSLEDGSITCVEYASLATLRLDSTSSAAAGITVDRGQFYCLLRWSDDTIAPELTYLTSAWACAFNRLTDDIVYCSPDHSDYDCSKCCMPPLDKLVELTTLAVTAWCQSLQFDHDVRNKELWCARAVALGDRNSSATSTPFCVVLHGLREDWDIGSILTLEHRALSDLGQSESVVVGQLRLIARATNGVAMLKLDPPQPSSTASQDPSSPQARPRMPHTWTTLKNGDELRVILSIAWKADATMFSVQAALVRGLNQLRHRLAASADSSMQQHPILRLQPPSALEQVRLFVLQTCTVSISH